MATIYSGKSLKKAQQRYQPSKAADSGKQKVKLTFAEKLKLRKGKQTFMKSLKRKRDKNDEGRHSGKAKPSGKPTSKRSSHK